MSAHFKDQGSQGRGWNVGAVYHRWVRVCCMWSFKDQASSTLWLCHPQHAPSKTSWHAPDGREYRAGDVPLKCLDRTHLPYGPTFRCKRVRKHSYLGVQKDEIHLMSIWLVSAIKMFKTTCVRGIQTAFAEKHWLLTWVHKLTKNRSLASLSPFCVCLCFKPFSLQSLCNHLGFQKGQNW
jgi:hypothetical protein